MYTRTFEEKLPLDHATHQCLVEAVLARKGDSALATAHHEQIALLTGAARSVAADVQRAAARLPQDRHALAPANVVLAEAKRCLAGTLAGTARCAQGSYGPCTSVSTASRRPHV
ncbi:restriction endonuclease [Streptomyces sp. NPDC087428]|uniref:restriction endonuclease n=1 Tax=Streptomyces sp. NPDC087428 TaxID=3365788 RepID=UPI003817C75B